MLLGRLLEDFGSAVVRGGRATGVRFLAQSPPRLPPTLEQKSVFSNSTTLARQNDNRRGRCSSTRSVSSRRIETWHKTSPLLLHPKQSAAPHARREQELLALCPWRVQ